MIAAVLSLRSVAPLDGLAATGNNPLMPMVLGALALCLLVAGALAIAQSRRRPDGPGRTDTDPDETRSGGDSRTGAAHERPAAAEAGSGAADGLDELFADRDER